MSPLTGFLLGLVQGLTEFLPLSSSGHMVLAEYLLGIRELPAAFHLALDLATLLAAVLVLRPELGRILAFLASTAGIRWVAFRSDDLREGRRLFVALVVATLPLVAGLLLRERIEGDFDYPKFVGLAMLVTGAALAGAQLAPRGGAPIDPGAAFVMGLAQTLALLPGISRTAMAVASGLFLGVRRERVVRFSFLMSLPAVLGTALLEFRHVPSLAGPSPLALALAFAGALAAGLAAMQIMLRVVASGRLTWFALYCLAAGLAAVLLLPTNPR